MPPTVHVEDLGKRYALGEREQYLALRDVLARLPGRLLHRARGTGEPGRRDRPQAWALRHVTFDVDHGEVVGIIGNNGAGKSTLLKLLSRITYPTEGRAVMRGRVGSLLEVGSGFHPELTGSENILLNGAILGMKKAEIDRRFDEIVEFSGVSEFLSTPVKRYSTGMYMRLAFAVAAHLEPEILVVDEVLAVGDAEFQRKCLGRMRELAGGQGRTVLFVSHNMDAVQQLCSRTIWLEGGRVRADGPSDEVVPRYLSAVAEQTLADTWVDVTAANRSGSGEARFVAVRYGAGGQDGDPVPRVGAPLHVDLVVEATKPLRVGSLAVFLSTMGGTKLVNADPAVGHDLPIELPAGRSQWRLAIRSLHLSAGTYRLGLWIARGRGDRAWSVYDRVEAACDLVVSDAAGAGPVVGQGIVPCDFEFHAMESGEGGGVARPAG